MVRELYKLMKKSLPMAVASFNEFMYTGKEMKLKNYFQPRYLLRGESFCSLEYSNFSENTDRLMKVLYDSPE